MTYSVVVFSILIQGSTITPMIEKAKAEEKKMEDEKLAQSSLAEQREQREQTEA